MEITISIPERIYKRLRDYLFQNEKEQGAFLFANSSSKQNGLNLLVKDLHLIPSVAWDVQESFYLELNNDEKVKIMKKARDGNFDLIECHSHRNHGSANFSPSDLHGLAEFVEYVRWKLPGKKYGALVWTETSVIGKVWDSKSLSPFPVREIQTVKNHRLFKIIKALNECWQKLIEWLKKIYNE